MRVTKISSIFAIRRGLHCPRNPLSPKRRPSRLRSIPMSINLLDPFSTLLGTTAITQNLSTAISINNNSTAAQRGQALIDNTITTDNGVVLSDGLGTTLNTIWRANNSQALPRHDRDLFDQSADACSGRSTRFRKTIPARPRTSSPTARPTARCSSATPIWRSARPRRRTHRSSVFRCRRAACSMSTTRPTAPVANPNLTGNSRPFQVSSRQHPAFSGADYLRRPRRRTRPSSAASPQCRFRPVRQCVVPERPHHVRLYRPRS